jgi:hypothetical protein
MKLVEVNCKKKLNVDSKTAWWNQWDHEHFSEAHIGFKETQVFYEDNKCAVVYLKISLPIISFFSLSSLHFMVQKDENNMIAFSNFLGCPSVTQITIVETKKDFCEFNMNYKFFLSGWQVLLAPIISYLAPKWNERSWVEDLPLKERRFLLQKKNFIDFYGTSLNENKKSVKNLNFSLPVKKLNNSKVLNYLNKYLRNYKNY